MNKTAVLTVGIGAALASSDDPGVVDVGTAVLGIGLAQAIGLFAAEPPQKLDPLVAGRASVIALNDAAVMGGV